MAGQTNPLTLSFMKIPKRLQPLVDDGMVDEVLFQLMSGKEAQVFVVRCGDSVRCAKVYKEAQKRSFKQAVQYQEGRKVRNSRRARAMDKKTRYGQKEQEDAWLNAEVDALYRLADAGVRVPEPFGFVDGVLLMEMITDEEGKAAPRLDDVTLTPEQAREYHAKVIADVVRMLSVSVHSTTFCHPGEFVPTVTSHFPTRGYSHEKAPHPGTVASPG